MESEVSKLKHILIVDDDDGIRIMLEHKLSKLGYRASIAANGLHALQKVRSRETSDLIICDLKMPGMSGLEFIKLIRQAENLKALPVLLITGYPEKQKILEVVRTGINRVLLKPFKHHQIVELIEEILLSPGSLAGGEQDPSVA
jgi:CheY-like chemotaxis protein